MLTLLPYEIDLLARRHRDFLCEIEPFVKIKREMYALSMPLIAIHADGRVEMEHKLTEQQREIVGRCDELIETARKRVGQPPVEQMELCCLCSKPVYAMGE